MPEEMDLVKLNAINRYVKDVQHMRLSSSVANDLRVRANDVLKKILIEATASAKSENRTTIMPRDADPVIERIFIGKNLATGEIFQLIKKLSPIDLGQLSKLITEYIITEKARTD